MLDACKPVESNGFLETALKMKSLAGQVFRYGVQTARCERDVTQDLKGALKQPPVKHYPAILDPKEFGAMLGDIDDYNGLLETRSALKLIAMLFVRAGEIRYAKWDELDLDKKTWTFTPRKTKRKTGISLIVPLPDQAIEILTALSEHRRSEFVFPAIHTSVQPMSENTMNQALKRLGIAGDIHTIHGFRAMIVEQLNFSEQLVEMQLGHRVRDMHGRAHNRTTLIKERKEMLQKWADYLDELKS